MAGAEQRHGHHFYIYAVDDDFGPFFIKFRTYVAYNAAARQSPLGEAA